MLKGIIKFLIVTFILISIYKMIPEKYTSKFFDEVFKLDYSQNSEQ